MEALLPMRTESRNSFILFWLGIAGIVFYVTAPVLFPHAAVRQPELIPLYTSMIGGGMLLKPKDKGKVKKESNEADE